MKKRKLKGWMIGGVIGGIVGLFLSLIATQTTLYFFRVGSPFHFLIIPLGVLINDMLGWDYDLVVILTPVYLILLGGIIGILISFIIKWKTQTK